MGIGGDLMWTVLFKEVWKKENNPKLKIIPFKNGNIAIQEIWFNNPYITYDKNYTPHKKLDLTSLSGHGTHNMKLCTRQKDNYLDYDHIINNRCKHWDINNPELKCDIFFTKQEIQNVETVIKTLPKQFICIEPHSKGTYTKNKYYPFDKWQVICNSISKYPVVQIGVKDKQILDNVIDLTGRFTFRETAYLLKFASYYIGIEGGLAHCCNAVGCKGLIVVPPIFNPKLTAYPGIDYLWLGTDEHKSCGMRIKCDKCHNIIHNHDENEVIKRLKI